MVAKIGPSTESPYHFSQMPQAVCSWLGRKVTISLSWLHARYLDIANYVASFFRAKPLDSAPRPIVRDVNPLPPPAIQLDPAMIKLQAFITSTLRMIGVSVYNRFIDPIFQAFLNNPVISPSSKAAWEALSLKVATVIADEIILVLDNAMAASSSEIKLLLSWLLGGKTTDELTQALGSISTPKVVGEFVNWLSDKEWLLADGPIPDPKASVPDADPSILKKLLVASIQSLIDSKVRAFLDASAAIIKDKVAPTIEKTIEDNSAILGDIVGRRAAALIQAAAPINPPESNQPTIYQQSYDQLLTLVFNQVDAISKAGKGASPDALLKAFAASDVCDPRIRKIINNEAPQDQVEQAISDQFASRLIALLLPDQKSGDGGFTITTPGIVLALRTLQFPSALQDAFKAFVSWEQDFFGDEAPASVQMLYDAVVYFLEKAVASIVYDQLKTGLSTGLSLGMNYVIPPAYLNMLMVQGAFPTLFTALVQGLLATGMQTPTDDTVMAFMPLCQANCKRSDAYAALAPKLYIVVRRACTGIDIEKAGMDQTKFMKSMTPFLDKIADNLVQQAGGTQATSAQVKGWLVDYTKPYDAGSNITYGNLLADLMFNIGNFNLLGNQNLARYITQLFLKNLMSHALTSALNPLRQNEQLFVSGVLQGLGQVMSTQEQIDDILWAPVSPAQEVSAQLATSLDQTASLIDSLARKSVDQLASGGNWASTPFKNLSVAALKKLLPSHDSFKSTLTKVYSTLLSNRLMNENLYIGFAGSVLTGVENVQATTPIPFP